MFKKALCVCLSIVFLLSAATMSGAVAFADTPDALSLEQPEISITKTEKSFVSFIKEITDPVYPDTEVKVLTKEDERVVLKDGDTYSATVLVEQAGLYALKLTYKNVEGRSNMPSLKLAINGEYQFDEAAKIKLKRQYKETETTRDSVGNEVNPDVIEVFDDLTCFVKDISGMYGDVLYFHLDQGENTINIEMDLENIELSEITFAQPTKVSSYKDVSAGYTFPEYKGQTQYYQAEVPHTKSDTAILRANDSTSPSIQPYNVYVKNLNVMGGENWNESGQYIEWEVNVPDDALYALTFKYRQHTNIGSTSYRNIYIDGEIPFAEFSNVGFSYDTAYKNCTLSVDGKPALIELSAGKHIIRMEVSLGNYKDLLSDINESIENLNTAYRKIIMLTTANPDSYRDYKIPENLPEVMVIFEEEKAKLERYSQILLEQMGGNATEGTSILSTVAQQLEKFIDDPYRMTTRLSNFKTNISSLTNWMQNAKKQPLQLDYLVLSAPDAEIEKATAGFFATVKHEAISFINTFSDDYLNYSKDENSIDVWITGGQVQLNTIRSIVESGYNTTHDTQVNVKLVTASLLMAVVSGKGPDIALAQDDVSVMNYAFRDAVVDISRFDDLDEVLTRFRDSTKIQVTFNDKMYGLPESQIFNMLYYRTDIMSELKLKTPNNWTEVISVMSALKKKNLEFGLPTSLYQTVLYQRGGRMYNDELTKTEITTLPSIEAFDFVCSLFTDYSVPKAYEATNRFRTGEMPIMVSPYNFCCTLTLAAPEIEGKWEMALMPGTVRDDGTFDRSITSDTGYAIILNEAKADKCWDFLKWWTSNETTYNYATTLERLLGPSVRSTTCNVDTFNKLPWNPEDLAKINEQAEDLVAIPAVPGNYFVGRHLSNAMNRVFYSNGVPAEELESYSKIIDKEIDRKREELGFK